MAKPNKIWSYTFGVLAGLTTLTSSADAQDKKTPNLGGVQNVVKTAPKPQVDPIDFVDLDDAFANRIHDVFNSKNTKDILINRVTYGNDSLVGNRCTFELQISDAEQLFFEAQDNGDSIITEDETLMMVYFYTNSKSTHQIIVRKGDPAPEDLKKYHVIDISGKTKENILQFDANREFPYVQDWDTMTRKSSFDTDNDLMNPFVKLIKKQKPATNKIY